MPQSPILTGDVVWPDDPRYDVARQDFNARFNIFPAVIVFCNNSTDVSNAVQWARYNGVPIRMRCGRHDYEAFSLVQNGIIIDVSNMNAIDIDPEQNVAFIQAGATLLPIYELLWVGRLTIPGGSCPTVGISGLTLGGGFGLSGRMMGMTCDSLLAVELVNANGELLVVDNNVQPDLFWACRGGGGGNFGIATRFVFQLHPVDMVTIFFFDWPWDQIADVINAWQAWVPGADNRLTPILKLNASSTGMVHCVGQFIGPQEELAAAVAQLTDVVPPSTSKVEYVTYLDAVLIFAGLKPGYEHWAAHWNPKLRSKFKNTSHYAYAPIGSDAIQTIQSYLSSAPSSENLLQWDGYGGAVNNLSRTATAFPHRAGALASWQYQAYWENDSDAAANIAWINNFRADMSAYMPNAAYRNYDDLQIVDWGEAYYQENFPGLIAVKNKYDPENIFQFPQSIPTGTSYAGAK